MLITQSIPVDNSNYQELDTENFNFLTFYRKVKNAPVPKSYFLLTADARKLFKSIKKTLQLVGAAGGLVRNEENKYLFIFRKGKWDLPKGKIDSGERTRDAAVREVEEECGIKVNKLGEKICKTWHVYEMGGSVVLKKTSWYHMVAKNQPHLIPQLEEGITDARWISPGDFGIVRANTYGLVLDILGTVE
ncbi:NUDIX hydrolase [Hufsiella ginkgonis]|uniref:NUDIX hydrolase n=1 Tax=Hufsiella ginkgonis TaxID=2695274 RepID=UPI0034E2EAEA